MHGSLPLRGSRSEKETAMKIIVATLIGLSVVVGLVAPVSAADFGSRDYWVDRDRHQN
jgi:hypothetical protein